MEEASDWSELLVDLLELIVRRLDRFPDEHVRFGAVCESWRSVAMENNCHIPLNQFPGLMVPGTYENSPTRCFFQLNHEKNGFFEDANYSKKQLEVPHGHACSGSAYGWLFLTDDELNTELLNPFSGAKIQLPSVATLPPALEGFHPRIKGYVFKAIFSSNPSCYQQVLDRRPPPVILIIYGGSMPRLAYCKPGDEAWTALECLSNQKYYFMDAIYYKNLFLALDSDGEIMALEINAGRSCSSSDTTTSTGHCEVKVTRYAFIPGIQYAEDMFLVELEGVLVVLTRKVRYRNQEISSSDDIEDGDDEDDNSSESDDDHEDDEDENDDDNYEGTDYRNAYSYGNIRTAGFTMLRFVTSEQKWVKVKSLGDNDLFLGYNTSFSLRASEYPGCIPNSVYFTRCMSEDDGYDMGIYSLTDKSIKPLYSIGSRLTKPSPIWITRLPSVLAS